MSTEQIRDLLTQEAAGMQHQRIRLLTLIGLVEAYLAGDTNDAEERALWLNRRRAWLMELAAIEIFLGLPRSIPPKALRRDSRIAHGEDRRNGRGLDRRGAEPR